MWRGSSCGVSVSFSVMQMLGTKGGTSPPGVPTLSSSLPRPLRRCTVMVAVTLSPLSVAASVGWLPHSPASTHCCCLQNAMHQNLAGGGRPLNLITEPDPHSVIGVTRLRPLAGLSRAAGEQAGCYMDVLNCIQVHVAVAIQAKSRFHGSEAEKSHRGWDCEDHTQRAASSAIQTMATQPI